MGGGEEAPELHVCQERSCRRRGSETTLAEIEALAGGLGCTVAPSGCLGYCDRGPTVVVVHPPGPCDPCDPFPSRVQAAHTRVGSLERSAEVVASAAGVRPDALQSGGAGGRDPTLARLRQRRARQAARDALHWNRALAGLQAEAEAAAEAAHGPALRRELAELLRMAGFPEGPPHVPGSSAASAPPLPERVDSYTEWTVESVTPVSRHSAVYRLLSSDRKRGTPHPRGGGRPRPAPSTWHTVLLAAVGPNNGEGPLPWVERDYTPTSSAAEWELGRAELLVKIYPQGRATQWLAESAPAAPAWAQQVPPAVLRLSRPVRTLVVPELTAEVGQGFQPAGVLLLLAGTGVVALPQLMAHRDPVRLLGMGTPRRERLGVPIDALLSFSEDDVLLVPEVAAWCSQGLEAEGGCWRGLRRCTMVLTARDDAARGSQVPFPQCATGDAAEAEATLGGLPNVRMSRGGRLSVAAVAEAVGRMPRPCRAVVSGPGGFNAAARRMLTDAGLGAECVTVLAA